MIRSFALVAVALILTTLPALAATVTRTETVTATASIAADKVNINTASVKDLMTLAGVGRKVAESIVQYRQERGAFQKAADVRRVDGVSAQIWERNKTRIVVK